MNVRHQEADGTGLSKEAVASLRALVVDDSKAQRKLLSLSLARWGYDVVGAASGDEALLLCQQSSFDLVVSDWVMPGMTGLEFCRAFRALPRDGYGYFILLTAKSDKGEIADGLHSGADDFLTKPVSLDELRARLRAGERILGMQKELVEKNRLVEATLETLQKLYDSLDRDLMEARRLQQTLVRDRSRDFGDSTVAMLLRPSGRVGGDLVGCFEISKYKLAVYSVDVSGHGVASAMMTARLSGLLSGGSSEQNMALRIGIDGAQMAWPPELVAARLNRLMIEDLRVEQYFTMAYAEIDRETGKVWLVQAGHPHPLILRKSGQIDYLGEGGLPIGLIPEAKFEGFQATLAPGDRLILVSDGVTECPNEFGTELGENGLTQILIANNTVDSATLLEALVRDLAQFHGGVDFPDDVSMLVFDFKDKLSH